MNLIETYNGSGFYAQYAESAVYDANGTPLTSYLTAVPAGMMNESAFEYDASDNITAYNGSAFKAGDEFPQSATEAIETVTANSADWNGTTETVSSNSGAWGGSALPISAGPGIKVNIVDNTLVFSNDETVLWSGTLRPGNSAQMIEPVTNFNSYKVYLLGIERQLKVIDEFWADDTLTASEGYKVCPIIYQDGGGFFTINAADAIWNNSWDNLNYVTGYNKWMPFTASTWNQIDVTASPTITKVVGINRIAGGN